jgi:alanine racemase
MYNDNRFGKSLLEVDISRVVANYRKMLSLTGSQIAAVIKANAYGLGAKQVAAGLYKAGCRDFCLAYIDEVAEVRSHIKGASIYLFNSIDFQEYDYVAKNKIIPVLNTWGEIAAWSSYAREISKKLPCIIHIETGMGRVGIQESEARRLVDSGLLVSLDVRYIMSHLACADEPNHILNQQQLRQMHKLAGLFPQTKITFANSAGLLLGKEYHFDQVRLGCALYGVNPVPDNPTAVIQVAVLKAYVLCVRTLEHDMTISYGATHLAKKGSKIATLACGYADGYCRALSNKVEGYYAGYRIPIIGVITMDAVMADVSHIPDHLLDNMTHVELMGDNITVDELAERAKTIGYEILTSLGHRFKRIYIE